MAAVQHWRWGGFVLSPETAAKWASRITGKEMRTENLGNLFPIQAKLRPYKVAINFIGDSMAEMEYMVVTQSERLMGYKQGSPIPQFEEGEREAMARPLLEGEGQSIMLAEIAYLTSDCRSDRL
jgi:hypothetical protein